MADVPYQRIHVVVNPASGNDEPVLSILNDVFSQYGVDWDISVTHKYGDAGDAGAGRHCRRRGHGGGLRRRRHPARGRERGRPRRAPQGRQVVMGILPGGTGNGFAREIGVPRTLARPSRVALHEHQHPVDRRGRLISVAQAQVDGPLLHPAVYVGVEPEEQTSREQKDNTASWRTPSWPQRSGSGTRCRYHVRARRHGSGLSRHPRSTSSTRE